MASRIIFLPKHEMPWFEEKIVTFEWVPGLAKSQAIKSVINLHEAAKTQHKILNPLEISTKSNSNLGITLSAFNLKLDVDTESVIVESAYQSSKLFKNGGPYKDILQLNPYEAKKDERIKNSGQLIGFEFQGNNWNITKSPNFYDYLYISALNKFEIKDSLQDFDAFTDIAFSQTSLKYSKKLPFNCQARSVAIYIGLRNSFEKYQIINILFDLTQKNSEIIDGYQLSLDI